MSAMAFNPLPRIRRNISSVTQPALTGFLLTSHLLLASPAAEAQATTSPPPHLLDPARLLMQSGGALSAEDIHQLFATGVTANMGVPPEYLGVRFSDRRTGQDIPPGVIREQMGAARQDGAIELLLIAEMLVGDRLPMPVEQIITLMDAAYLASMRNPPPYIDIEYYDIRTGPTGQPGGGVSGSTPHGGLQAPNLSSAERAAQRRQQLNPESPTPHPTRSDTSRQQDPQWQALIRDAEVTNGPLQPTSQQIRTQLLGQLQLETLLAVPGIELLMISAQGTNMNELEQGVLASIQQQLENPDSWTFMAETSPIKRLQQQTLHVDFALFVLSDEHRQSAAFSHFSKLAAEQGLLLIAE